MPLAYLITFRTYGTWLHGDERGSMERRQFNGYGQLLREAAPALERAERLLLKHQPVRLDPSARLVVEQAIGEVTSRRRWYVSAVAVRTEHVHVVVSAENRPESVLQALKAAATRALRDAGIAAPGSRVWSRHGSTRYLWDDRSVASAIEYVVDGQDRPPM